MKLLKINFPIILLIIFETAVGILLLVDPEAFTRAVIVLFGVILLVIGIIYLIRYLSERKRDIYDPLSLLIAVITLIFGVTGTFFSDVIIGVITAVAIIYGVILVVSGLYKLSVYFQARKMRIPVSKVNAVSGLLAVILGLAIAVYPQDALLTVWQVAGIMLILEAVIDSLSIIQVVRIDKISD